MIGSTDANVCGLAINIKLYMSGGGRGINTFGGRHSAHKRLFLFLIETLKETETESLVLLEGTVQKSAWNRCGGLASPRTAKRDKEKIDRSLPFFIIPRTSTPGKRENER